jgi:hypothetical protein
MYQLTEVEVQEMLDDLEQMKKSLKNQIRTIDEVIKIINNKYMSIEEYFEPFAAVADYVKVKLETECVAYCMKNKIPVKSSGSGYNAYPLIVIQQLDK